MAPEGRVLMLLIFNRYTFHPLRFVHVMKNPYFLISIFIIDFHTLFHERTFFVVAVRHSYKWITAVCL